MNPITMLIERLFRYANFRAAWLPAKLRDYSNMASDWAFAALLMNYDWHFANSSLLIRFSCFIIWFRALLSRCSKKKLLQQRSLQTSDRPTIPNFLMMPAAKNVEKGDQYVVEWVFDELYYLQFLQRISNQAWDERFEIINSLYMNKIFDLCLLRHLMLNWENILK